MLLLYIFCGHPQKLIYERGNKKIKCRRKGDNTMAKKENRLKQNNSQQKNYSENLRMTNMNLKKIWISEIFRKCDGLIKRVVSLVIRLIYTVISSIMYLNIFKYPITYQSPTSNHYHYVCHVLLSILRLCSNKNV